MGNNNKSLAHNGETDYVMKGPSIWITVNTLSVYVKRTEDKVEVDIFRLGKEMEDPLSSTCVFFDE